MIIVVCIKQVPEVAAVKIDPKTKTLVREGVPSILNPFDEFAVEEALRIKEKHGGDVIIVTMGPPQAREAIMKCLAMGADRAIHLTDIAFSGADTLATSYTLTQAIRQHVPNFDIILCGKQAIDGNTAQVPSLIPSNVRAFSFLWRFIVIHVTLFSFLTRIISNSSSVILVETPLRLLSKPTLT